MKKIIEKIILGIAILVREIFWLITFLILFILSLPSLFYQARKIKKEQEAVGVYL